MECDEMERRSVIEVRAGHRPLVDAYAAGEYIGLCEATIRRKAYSGEITSYKIGKRLLFNLDELDRYIAEHRRPRPIQTPAQRKPEEGNVRASSY